MDGPDTAAMGRMSRGEDGGAKAGPGTKGDCGERTGGARARTMSPTTIRAGGARLREMRTNGFVAKEVLGVPW